jgi:hypothetical protein
MEENNLPHHQSIPENRLTPLQHRIQHAHRNGYFKDTYKIWMSMHPPRMDQQHTPGYNQTQSLAQTRNYH